MAVFTIAGLTLKEAVRRRTLLGSLLLGLLILGLSLLLMLIRQRILGAAERRHDPLFFAQQYPIARSIITSLCLFAIRSLGSLFAVLLAGGAISGEIERGLLAVILPKPIPRWQILLGKWIGLNIVLAGSVLLWTIMVWASLTLQTHVDLTPLLTAGLYLTLYPLVISTVALSFSVVAQRLFGTSLALTLCAFAWFDGVFNLLGNPQVFDVPALRILADIAGMTVPLGYIAWWVEDSISDIMFMPPNNRGFGVSPRFLKEWGSAHLHFAHLDSVYFVGYVLLVLLAGMFLFHKRDVS